MRRASHDGTRTRRRARGQRISPVSRPLRSPACAIRSRASHGSHEVRAEIARAARDFGRDPAGITLVAVSKTFPAEAIEPVLEAGQRVFGENYVQEAKAKWPALARALPGRRAAHDRAAAVEQGARGGRLFDAIQTLDRDSLAAALAKEIARAGPRAAPPRAGQHRRGAAEGRRACRRKPTPSSRPAASSTGLTIEGLMCIPPADEPPSPHFALLAKIAETQRARTRSRWA